MVLTCLLCLLGYQILLLGLSARTLSVIRGFSKSDSFIQFVYRKFSLEKGLFIGFLVFIVGFLIDGWIAYDWAKSGFGPLHRVRPALFALLLMVLGTQTVFFAFFLSMLGILTEKDTGSDS